jgi:hypothetical protein
VRERVELFAMGKTPLKMNGIVTQKISLSNDLGFLGFLSNFSAQLN